MPSRTAYTRYRIKDPLLPYLPSSHPWSPLTYTLRRGLELSLVLGHLPEVRGVFVGSGRALLTKKNMAPSHLVLTALKILSVFLCFLAAPFFRLQKIRNPEFGGACDLRCRVSLEVLKRLRLPIQPPYRHVLDCHGDFFSWLLSVLQLLLLLAHVYLLGALEDAHRKLLTLTEGRHGTLQLLS